MVVKVRDWNESLPAHYAALQVDLASEERSPPSELKILRSYFHNEIKTRWPATIGIFPALQFY